MAKKKLTMIIAIALAVVVAATTTIIIIATGKKSNKDSIVIMSEELNGLFNPYYATTGADQEIVGMTQIGMLSTDANGNPCVVDADGTAKAVVAKAFEVEQSGGYTYYRFVLKNGLKFSDGVPLTMNDVMFNYYELLDPAYTGSSTLYSTKIVGLTNYRTQKQNANEDAGSTQESNIENDATSMAENRIYELIDIFTTEGLIEGSTSSYNLTEAKMLLAISDWEVSEGYKKAVATNAEAASFDFKNQLREDYYHTLETFKKELETDYKSSQDAYDFNTKPYSDWKQYKDNEIFKFLLTEGKIIPNYDKIPGTSRDDKLKILSFDGLEALDTATTKEQAIDLIYNGYVNSKLHIILSSWGTASTLANEYIGAAKDIILHNANTGDSLLVPNITGIVSLGHVSDINDENYKTSVTMNGEYGDKQTYTIAHEHNADGTPKNANEYDVLQVKVIGTDPKAIYSFGLTIAPVHYYTADSTHPNGREVDIANNKFGVEYASSTFQSKVIQSQAHVEVPVGAGPYKATDKNNADNPKGSNFYSSNIVYFKANTNFMYEVKCEKVRYQVVSSANAISKLTSGEVDFVTPQFTKTNAQTLNGLKSKGIETLSAWQLGYGYIGINAGKVEDINVRKAIMAAMQTSLALEYYEAGTVQTIDWPMSNRSWAYPKDAKGDSKANGKDYATWTTKADAIQKINTYCPSAYTEKLVFTIAGSSITEHPTYQVFAQAAEILNGLGWNVEVKADSQALTKLSTGSLQVWAAAWGSTIDPDMYQVYHINSKATSVNAWGYREIKNGKSSTYATEYGIITAMSTIIDDAREIMDKDARKTMYEQAMGMVLDLAVELPVYQRQNLYAYNSKTIKGIKSTVNEYTSPLEKIWELELVK